MDSRETESLFDRASEGDAGASAGILRIVRGFARRVCRIGGPRGTPDFDWEDVAQEAMRKLFDAGLRQYRGTGSERSYLYTVVKGTVIEMARSAQRRRKREEAVVAGRPSSASSIHRRLDLRAILARLPPECRGLIERVVFLDEPYSRLAQELGLAESSVRSRLNRCLDRARDIAAGGAAP